VRHAALPFFWLWQIKPNKSKCRQGIKKCMRMLHPATENRHQTEPRESGVRALRDDGGIALALTGLAVSMVPFSAPIDASLMRRNLQAEVDHVW
jgi:hypothetical protein